ncbi:MAG TPA: MMPL family transporter [Bacteroidales bacterium]|nr:MMPL family transporter [Bacteroidales bacterium]
MQPSGLISDRMTDFVIRNRWIIITSCILLGIISGIIIPFSETDPEIRNYIPASMKSRIDTDTIENEFGVQDMVVILFTDSSILERENLEVIRNIDRALSRMPGITSRTSPFTVRSIKSEEGAMIAERLIKRIPEDSDETRELQQKVTGNRFAENIVFSHDMTSASITAFIDKNIPETETLRKIDSIIRCNPARMEIRTGGLPYIRKYIISDVRKDAIKLVPLALLIMLLILKITLGSWRSVIMPFSVVMISTFVSMGLLPLIGWKMSIITLLLPIIMVAVANNYGIYLTARQQEIIRSEPSLSGREVLRRLYRSLNMPILFSGLTTIAGILGLLTHSIIPARQVGILAATGVAVALFMSLMLIPSLIYQTGPGDSGISKSDNKNLLLDKLLKATSRFIIKHSGKILIISALVTIILSTGILIIRIDTNQENYFPAKHPVKMTSELINKKFGGSQTISVMLEGDILSPEVMKGIDNMTRDIEKMDGVGDVYSISLAIREMSKAIFSEDEKGYNSIPDSKEAISQMFELYYMSGEPDDFKQLINPENTKAHVLIKLSDASNANIKLIKKEISGFSGLFPATIVTGGYAIIMDDFAGEIIKGQASSLILALFTVFILLSIIFRSFKGGMTGSIPLAFSILIGFGFMGLTGIALDAATALLSSIMIGVGVDFTIQYLWCFNLNFKKGIGYIEATQTAITTIGRSIIINAMGVMAGFSVLMFSGFLSIRFFGYMVFISIGSCLIGALLIIPAFILKFRPSFVEKDFERK